MRIGILGTGFGKRHAEIYKAFPDVEVVGIAGRNKQRTEEIAQALDIRGYTDPSELIRQADIDAIDVCLPTGIHSEYVTAALTQGKHVFCETPLAYTLAEAKRMSQVAASCNKLLLVALFGRFVSDYSFIQEYIAEGNLGKPRVLFANRRTPAIWGNGWNENFILDLMLHDIDYAYWLLGKPLAVTSRALSPAEKGWEHVFVALEYEDASAVIEGCGIMPESFPFSTSLRVVCEKGAIDLTWSFAGELPVSEVELYPDEGSPELIPISGYDPYEAECRYFADCVQGKADPSLLGIETACGSLEIALAARTSLEQSGKRIELR